LKAELIVNLTAGGGKPNHHLTTILEYLKKNGLNYEVCTTSRQGEAVELARKAADNGVEFIVSVGGDGTVNEIVNGIMKSKHSPALGIIPLGWANDFIKSTGIPSDIIIWPTKFSNDRQINICRSRGAENKIFVACSNSIYRQGTGHSLITSPSGQIITSCLGKTEQASLSSLNLLLSRNKEIVPHTNTILDRKPESYNIITAQKENKEK